MTLTYLIALGFIGLITFYYLLHIIRRYVEKIDSLVIVNTDQNNQDVGIQYVHRYVHR